ncbi:MAG: transketolase C-terminal domain-containing protein, partial [Candidatus Omnitrophota bacterium]
ITFGPIDLQDYYFEHKMQQADAMRRSKDVILDVAEEFGKVFGRKSGLIEPYAMDDAEIAIIGLGSTMGTLKVVTDHANSEGAKAGLVKIRVFRPFPREEIADSLKNVKAVAVLDRADSMNAVSGPLYSEVKAALYGKTDIPITDYIYGLGGRDITVEDLAKVIADLQEVRKTGKIEQEVTYLGVRE